MTTNDKAQNEIAKAKAGKKRRHARNRQIAYLIHDSLHLTFAQCVQLLVKGEPVGHIIANRNIHKENKERERLHSPADGKLVLLSEFDAETFNNLLKERLEWAKSSVQFRV